MKVKESLYISNKKKNALPSSKLLKPKKFKPSQKKSGESKNPTLSKEKLKLVTGNGNINSDLKCDDSLELKKQEKSSKKEKTMKNSLGLKEKISPHASSPKKPKRAIKESAIKNVFDFFISKEQKVDMKHGKISVEDKRGVITPSFEKNQSSKTTDKDQNKENETTVSDKQNLKASKTLVTQEKKKKEKVMGGGPEKSLNRREKIKKASENKQLLEVVKDQNTGNDLTAINKCKLKASKVAVLTKGLLKLIDESSSSKPEILDVGEPVFLQVECIKIPICPTKQLRFKLPHPLVDETSDVLLITADLKGHKIYPDKAVEHYEELLAKHEINFINKVMPLRMVKKEYSQYEMKRKLVDQFDVILADSRIIKSLPAVLGKFALYKRKMPVPVNLRIGEHKLKKLLQDAVCKTQMTVKSSGHCSVAQIGHSKMNAKEMAANIVEVAKSLETLYPGGWRNVRSLVVKTAKSTALPVYLSLLSPNEVKIPVEVRRRPKPVEGELSTMPGYNVVVTADGNVILKKVEEEWKIDNSRDDEILEEAEKYLESSKTVRYDDSSDEEKNEEKENSDSDDEGEAITEAMEKKLMNKYEKNAKTKKNKKEEEDEDDEEEEEEEEEGSEEESEIIPVTGKKRKSQGTKKQSGPAAKKAFSAVESKGKGKEEKPGKDNKKTASPGFMKQQKRGTRGGKKNKLSKDQRKALIKRKKAGKK